MWQVFSAFLLIRAKILPKHRKQVFFGFLINGFDPLFLPFTVMKGEFKLFVKNAKNRLQILCKHTNFKKPGTTGATKQIVNDCGFVVSG